MTNPPVSTETVLSQLRWRYAAQKFDPARKIPPEQWSALEQALVLTPSSFGFEPWKFYVVDDWALREALAGASYGQAQLVEASHVVVFTTKKGVGMADVEALIERTTRAWGVTRDSVKGHEESLAKFMRRLPPGFDVDGWSTRQVYIALGNFMTAAAMLGIDTCPMEGINHRAYDAALGLAAQGYTTAVVCCAGYRAPDDKYASLPKVRRAHDDAVAHI